MQKWLTRAAPRALSQAPFSIEWFHAISHSSNCWKSLQSDCKYWQWVVCHWTIPNNPTVMRLLVSGLDQSEIQRGASILTCATLLKCIYIPSSPLLGLTLYSMTCNENYSSAGVSNLPPNGLLGKLALVVTPYCNYFPRRRTIRISAIIGRHINLTVEFTFGHS